MEEAVFDLRNCIIYGNTSGEVSACHDVLIDIMGTVNADYCQLGCVGNWGGWYNPTVVIQWLEPHFLRPPDDGGNGWGDDSTTPTINEGADDDYGNHRLTHISPGIDAGSDLLVPADTTDLDGDANTTERIPQDCAGRPRFFDYLGAANSGVADPPAYPEVVDLGAFEYQAPGDFNNDGKVDIADL